ncbi:phage tail protein [Pantoea sp. OXWO6B1]|uniref:phage tail protein n=1 Tax=Pantoea sp. OXWO6B1 TaxID=1835724 RepID=UPI0009EDDEA1|nr:phage tail protein [Pantoea sp. OXWO6B1]
MLQAFYQQLHLDKNLSLGEGSALPVGVPVPWPSANPPVGWLKCNGAAITSAQYPLLAKAYPSLKLPDLRGEFIRGWDDGRGVDSNRELLAAQIPTYLRTAMMDYNGSDVDSSGVYIGMAYSGADFVTKSVASPGGIYRAPNNSDLTNSVAQDNGVSGGASNTVYNKEGSVWITMRPRNIAFNYIVRAA